MVYGLFTPQQKKSLSLLKVSEICAPMPIGEEFEIVAGKLFAENEYKRLTAKYDDSGAFTLLISEVFSLQD
jgi:hypothetical protein